MGRWPGEFLGSCQSTHYGDFGIGTNTPVARLEIEDDGTSNAMLLKLTQDDTSVYGMVIGNDTYSTSDSVGGQHILNNEGNYIIRSLVPGAADRFGACIAFNNYNYLEIRKILSKLGYNFTGSCDTEVLFKLLIKDFANLAYCEPLYLKNNYLKI